MKIIYCDGSSLGNPGRAGFGVVAIDLARKKIWEYGGKIENGTNNQAELNGCIFALTLILKSYQKNRTIEKFEMRLDSQYVIKGTTEWSKNWEKNGWRNAQKKDVENKELWQQILKLHKEILFHGIKINWVHVYGHTGEKFNERVDEIAKAFAYGKEIYLKLGEKI